MRSCLDSGSSAASQGSSPHFVANFFLSVIVWAGIAFVFQRVHIQRLRLPPRPSVWEFMFQTYVFRRKLAMVLHNLVKRYGPVMHVRVWSQDLIVLSSVSAVEEFYKLHDMEFEARPSSMGRLTLSNTLRSLCFSPLATYWKHLHLVLDVTTSEPLDDSSTRGMECFDVLLTQFANFHMIHDPNKYNRNSVSGVNLTYGLTFQ